MQNSIRILFIVLTAVLSLNFKWHSVTCFLTGHIRNGKNNFTVLNKLHIYVTSNNLILDSAITDSYGNFNLQFNSNSADTLYRFYCYPAGKDTIQLKTVRWFESDTPEITFYLPGKRSYAKTSKQVNL